MQHSLAQLELDRVRAADRVIVGCGPARAGGRTRREPGAQRKWAAAMLARLAWRLDHEAALRVWP